MPTKLKIKIAKHSSLAAALAANKIHPRRRMLRAIFGTSRPPTPHDRALLGSEASTVSPTQRRLDDVGRRGRGHPRGQ